MRRATDFPAARTRLVDALVRSGYISDPRVRAAFETVPREAFVPEESREGAYADVPLPIPHGQTISAPSMIAIMLEEASLQKGERVLEVGTGSGYHAALLACLVGPENLVTIERIPALAAWGRENLARAGFSGVEVVTGDGSLGHPPRAPYDGIVATAGAPRIPDAWPAQLAAGGRIVAPVGRHAYEQVLLIVRKREDGTLELREGTPCAFVPLVGDAAWPSR
ncbi:MAG: protein-L-isoaspartate O-methyltransferase [Euryarchaeota archaeon RBG_16_68_13]|nr:MAG: protein-L-isoaspartate O-methyltransferase [Euryarchaeota archaeon RBG_16_68_13]